MELDRKELGRRIAKRRKEKKIRQYKLAGDIGVDPTHLSSIEAGRVTPSLEVLVKICDLFICLKGRCIPIMFQNKLKSTYGYVKTKILS